MKERIYKNAILSLVIINFWTLYGFFDYFTDEHGGMMADFGVLIFYSYSLYFAIGIGLITLLLRISIFRKQPNKLKSNFFYLFAAIFNLNLFIIWIISLVLKVLEIAQEVFTLFTILTLIISVSIFADILIQKKFNILKQPPFSGSFTP